MINLAELSQDFQVQESTPNDMPSQHFLSLRHDALHSYAGLDVVKFAEAERPTLFTARWQTPIDAEAALGLMHIASGHFALLGSDTGIFRTYSRTADESKEYDWYADEQAHPDEDTVSDAEVLAAQNVGHMVLELGGKEESVGWNILFRSPARNILWLRTPNFMAFWAQQIYGLTVDQATHEVIERNIDPLLTMLDSFVMAPFGQKIFADTAGPEQD
jgi:hypothetical protein